MSLSLEDTVTKSKASVGLQNRLYGLSHVIKLIYTPLREGIEKSDPEKLQEASDIMPMFLELVDEIEDDLALFIKGEELSHLRRSLDSLNTLILDMHKQGQVLELEKVNRLYSRGLARVRYITGEVQRVQTEHMDRKSLQLKNYHTTKLIILFVMIFIIIFISIFTKGLINRFIASLEIAKESESRLRIITDSAQDAILSTNKDGQVVFWNKAAQRVFQWQRDDILGESILVLMPTIKFGNSFQRTDSSYKVAAIRQDGSYFPSEVSSSYWEDKGEYYNTFIVSDISAKKAQIEKLEAQRKELFLNEKLASIGELAAGVGHEINNPLAIVKGYLEMTKREVVKDKITNKKILDSISKQEDAIERIIEIVDSLRTFARMDTDLHEVLNLHHLIEKTKVLTCNMMEKEGINIHVDLDAESSMVKGNTGRFQQILMILLTNAKDAIQDCDSPTITIKSQSTPNEIIISVGDNGDGIPDAIKNRIFDAFFTTKSTGQGTGIGLGLLAKVVAEMKGSVKFDSAIKVGTTFYLSFPLAEKIKTIKQEVIVKQQQKLQGNVLIVDDEEGIRELLSYYLECIGFNIDEADDGDTALEKVKEKRYDYICTDLTMPRMSGFDFIQEAKKLPFGDTTFIVITGGVSSLNANEEALTKLINGRIKKPFSEESVYEVFLNSKESKKVA